MTDLPNDITRINVLTTNARNTWFVLLGVLVFVGIILMGVEHIDFYGVNRATELPLVNVEVPTRYFFVAAPVLTAAIYGYFHLYLIRLWDVLGNAEPVFEGQPLGDAVSPWLVTDAALHLRRRLRDDGCTSARILEGPAMLLNFLLAWGFGPVVLGFMWWQSMPAREFLWITLVATLALILVLVAGAASLAMCIVRMRSEDPDMRINIWSTTPSLASFLIIIPTLLIFGYQRTEGPANYLTPLVMIDEQIVERPAGWLPYEIAHDGFRDAWCQRKGMAATLCNSADNQDGLFKANWQTRRRALISELNKPNWHKVGQEKPDLRNANLVASFFSGANLRNARLEGANLRSAHLEGAHLWDTKLQEATLRHAHLEMVDARGAQMQSARMSGAQLISSNFKDANLQEARLIGAKIVNSRFWEANMQGAYLERATIINSIFWDAKMSGADLRRATMTSSALKGAQLNGAQFDYSLLSGTPVSKMYLIETNLESTTNQGGAIRFADFTSVTFNQRSDFRNSFMDGSVKLHPHFALQMGQPCQWSNLVMSDDEFFARWRWWVDQKPNKKREERWSHIAPLEWRNVPRLSKQEIADLGLSDCNWKTDPLPDTETLR